MKYPLHREFVEKMLRDEFENGVTTAERYDWEQLIEEFVDDGYIERSVGNDLQALLKEKIIG